MRGDQLQRYLKKNVTQRVSLTLDDDRRDVVKTQPASSNGIGLTLHGSFLDAPHRVLRALVRFLRRPEPHLRRRVVRLFHETGLSRVGAPSGSRRIVLRHRGQYFDLKQVFDDLNARYFGSSIDARITWGQRCGKPRRRNSIKMGSYSVEERLIRVHRSLDRAFVPRFFVEWIVYHEMLHQVHRACVVNGRRQFHTRAFLEDEARFEHYAMARAWERAHLDDILTY